MRNDFTSNYFLEHSAKGRSWTKQNHKYVARVETSNGEYRYFYSQKDYDAYLSGLKEKAKKLKNGLITDKSTTTESSVESVLISPEERRKKNKK